MPGYIVKGKVQGVGFRPFVYRLAKRFKLKGYVRNLGDSVEIFIDRDDEEFLKALISEKPPLAEVEALERVDIGEREFDDFLILESESSKSLGSYIPADLSLCENCIQEIFSPGNRRYLYPFTVCTDCGVRFSIIEKLPYDRANTSMREFKLCPDCYEEYTSLEDRRFKAEPTCCGDCGPHYTLYTPKREIIAEKVGAIQKTAELLDKGKILAIKGVGGFHLACDASQEEAVAELRRRTNRESKPFAIMVRDLKAVKEICILNKKEEELLKSIRRPIVILTAKKKLNKVAPGLHTLGVMLPYAGVHFILFKFLKTKAIVMTSLNIAGEPMATELSQVLELGFADYILAHNRRIVNRIDDSVVRVTSGKTAFIRRSRGYAPEPVDVHSAGLTALGLGAEENVTPCLLLENRAFLTQYIGKPRSLAGREFLEQGINTILRLCGVEPQVIACDLNPAFTTTTLGEELAEKYGVELVRVQHHEAHIASVVAEHGINSCIGVALDGYGYGYGGEAWGGEVFSFNEGEFERIASVESFPLVGGDIAVKNPIRIAAALLGDSPEEFYKAMLILGAEEKEAEISAKQLRANLNVFNCTSFGRVLDAISAVLGVCRKRTYEGEPAMKLEAFAFQGRGTIDMPLEYATEGNREVLLVRPIIRACLEYIKEGRKKQDIAASAQKALARGMAELAVRKAQEGGEKKIALSGGVFYNQAIFEEFERVLKENRLELFTNEKVARGDNGLSLGQAYLARIANESQSQK